MSSIYQRVVDVLNEDGDVHIDQSTMRRIAHVLYEELGNSADGTFRGMATSSGSPAADLVEGDFYFATSGTYPNFSNISVQSGRFEVLKFDGEGFVVAGSVNLTQSSIPVIDSLSSNATDSALSAAKGKLLKTEIGDLSELNTSAKNSLVDALNELFNAESVSWDSISGKPTFSKVATSGRYADISGTPTFKTINGQSVIGSGNIVIEGGGSSSGVSDPTEISLSGSTVVIETMNYNAAYTCADAVTSLEVTAFGTTHVNLETNIYFTTGDTISVAFPSNAKYAPMQTIFRPNTSYVVSVQNGVIVVSTIV